MTSTTGVSAELPQISTEAGRGELRRLYVSGLLDDTLPFWIKSPDCVDREHGGFLHSLDRDGSLLDTDKAMWIQARFVWTLARAFNEIEPNIEFIDLANHGINFIRKHGFDTDGRMFFLVTREGLPLVKRRYIYTEMFSTMALAEVARATNSEELLDEAEALFALSEHLMSTPGLLPPKTNPEVRAWRGLGVPMIKMVTAQVLRDVATDPGRYTSVIDGCIAEIRDDFVRTDLEAVVENVLAADGSLATEHFDGRIINPGHGLEAAWFILAEAARRDDSSLIELGTQIVDWSWKRGWDTKYGGLFSYRDVLGLPVTEYWQDMKFWWPHNEGITATLLAHELTGEQRYAEWHQLIHDWSYQHFPDPEFGEWYGYLHRDGSPSVHLKGNRWKGPFHLPRMQMECYRILSR
ncbi:MAG: N-acylglucosamine 2-epimerase [bacterium]|nr:N-acylglucosamine 2-epimerase [bacterium]